MKRSGFTIVELLVCITVIGVVMSIALPAIHSAREAARQTQCRKNMKELGTAAHGFHTTYGTFPEDGHRFRDLLPYLEQQNLHDLMTSSDDLLPPGKGAVTSYICPSGIDKASHYEVSYSANDGTMYEGYRVDHRGSVANGMAAKYHHQRDSGVRIRDVYDGTSNTTLFCERKPGIAGDPLVDVQVPVDADPSTIGQLAMQDIATRNRRAANAFPFHLVMQDSYLHIVPPSTVDGQFSLGSFEVFYGLQAARGYHNKVANSTLVDGSVRTITPTIDLQVWQQLGSRDSRIK